MDQDNLKKAISFLEDLRHIKKKYDLDYEHLTHKHFSTPGSPFVKYPADLTYLFSGLTNTREREGDVIDVWYEDYTKQLLKTFSTESLTD